jgi:hypothetical protein
MRSDLKHALVVSSINNGLRYTHARGTRSASQVDDTRAGGWFAQAGVRVEIISPLEFRTAAPVWCLFVSLPRRQRRGDSGRPRRWVKRLIPVKE